LREAVGEMKRLMREAQRFSIDSASA